LDQLAQTFNFTWANMSGTIIVAPAKDMATTVKTFKVKYLDLNNLKAKIALFVESGKIAVNSDDSTITVDTTPTNVRKIQSIIDSEDNPPCQVLIQARMVELAKDDVEKLGLTYEWNPYSQGTAFNLGLKATFAANATLEHSKLISHPSILAYNGRKAVINLSDKVPILSTTSSSSTTTVTADYKDVGVMLEVTPIVNQDNTESITMDVHPTVSVITGTTTLNGSSYPTISSREAKTTVRMKNNETLIIGGLLKEDDVRNITKIPILGNLPLIGQLFQYHKNEKIKKEIVIFITPHIIDGSEQTTNNNIENAPVDHQ
jgi:type II secretory pathway component GspD/PulD (secretin)